MAGKSTGMTPEGPGGAERSPGGAKQSPGDAKRPPNDAKQSPGDAKRRPGGAKRSPGASAINRVGAAAVAGACAGVLASVLGNWQVGTLVGWDVAAMVYVAWTWTTIWRRDPIPTARLALREDPGRAAADALLLVASVASILAIGLVITVGRTGSSGATDVRAALAVFSVGLSWTVVQTVYTSRYARLYYSHPAGGIDFNQEAPPRYSDFAYLAFTVGMTYQVSDTALRTPQLRAALLGHALLSYLLGAVILATAINLVAGLLK
jgi:uncharacterized membrane protein